MAASGLGLGNTLKALGLAILNATFILVALCLWLVIQVLHDARSLADTFSSAIEGIAPLAAETSEVAQQIRDLRELLELTQGGETGNVWLEQVDDRIDRLESRIMPVADRLDEIAFRPEALVDHAVENVASEIRSAFAIFRECNPVDAKS